jgi:hypothetical protein
MLIPQDWTFFLWSSFIAGFGGHCPPYVLIEKTEMAFFFYLMFCFFSALGSRLATAANSASIRVFPVAAK